MKKSLASYFVIIVSLLITPAFANYTIIIDAGSSGSRLHLFHYTEMVSLPNIQDIFSENTAPSLSSYANKPEDAGPALKKLLDDATHQLQHLQVDPHQVSINVLGTGGMRLLPPDMQRAIYASVSNYIKQHYAFTINNFHTISGNMEGLFGWLDINYLNDHFQHHLPTVGNIDMGGASTQITFATQNMSQINNKMRVTIGKQTYLIFSKSFLGLGQDQARSTINTENTAYTCYPKNYPLSTTAVGNFNFVSCQHLYSTFLKQHQINQALVLPRKYQQFIAHAGVFYAYSFIGAPPHPDAASVENKIQAICTTSWDQLQHNYPAIPLTYLSSYCANTTYIHDLLYDTYGLNGSQLTVVNKINGQDIDWPLGALLYSLVSTPKKHA